MRNLSIAWSTVVTNSYNSWERCVSNDKEKQEISPEVDFSVPSACRGFFFLNVKSWTNISALLENWKKKLSNIKLTVVFVMIDAVGADLKCLIKRAGKTKRKKNEVLLQSYIGECWRNKETCCMVQISVKNKK